jgi:dTDP-4-dehydrorhamnose reductase
VKLLVTGGAGFLGAEICRQGLVLGYEVIATQHDTRPPHGHVVRLDVRDEDATQRVLMRHGPDVVVHTAYVQRGPEMETTVVRGSAAVAASAARRGARLVHLSTDLVFDGEYGAPYAEDDDPRPVSDYGAAKLEAETLVLRTDADALVVRTSLLCGGGEPGPQERLAARGDVTFYTDEIRCPTLVEDLAAALLDLALLDVRGVLHVAAAEAVSRYELARRLRNAAGLEPDAVRGAASPRDGRARDVSLDSARAARLLGRGLRSP